MRTQLGEGAFAAAWEAGLALSLEEAVAETLTPIGEIPDVPDNIT